MFNLFRRFKEWQRRCDERAEGIAREIREKEVKFESEIKPLPIDEARGRAEALLSASDRFHCTHALVSDQERRKLLPLAPLLREFFEQYSEVESADGEHHLTRQIEPADESDGRVSQRFLRIGYEFEEYQYVAKPGEEGIYILGDEIATPDLKLIPVDNPEVKYPTVYHLLLYIDLMRMVVD